MKSGGKRILMLTHEFPPMRGGIARYASELATAAHALGHEVTVVAPGLDDTSPEMDRNKFRFTVCRFRGNVYDAAQLPATVFRSLRASCNGGFDIIHALDRPHLYAMRLTNRLIQRPFVTTVYGTELIGIAKTKHTRWLGLLPLFKACTRICAISEYTRQLLAEECPEVSPEQTRVTSLGVDGFWFGQANDNTNALARFGIPNDRKLILTVSRLDERKGHREVIAALRSLPESLRDKSAYVIVGDDVQSDYGRELQALAADSPVPVILTGALSDEMIRTLYSKSSIFCMPGVPHPFKVEGFGLAYLEAAAQALPSIGTRIGGVPEVVRHNQTGIIIAPEDRDALAGAINSLLTDNEYWSRLGRNARQEAGQFTWRRCAEATYEGL